MITVGLIGLGLTGGAIARHLLEARSDLRVVMAGAGPRSPKAGQDLGALLGLAPCGVTVVDAAHVSDELHATRPQAIIDFSRPAATLACLGDYAAIGCGVVVGTTGFSDAEIAHLRETASTDRFGLMYAPNITRGVNVLMLLARLASRYLSGYDIEVVERHHRRKKDAPSGTAFKLVRALAAEDGAVVHGREGMAPRGAREIGVHAVRAGGIIGVHEVLFAGEYDEVTIVHRSESRVAFAAGAADAAEWMAGRHGFYTVEDMILSGDTEPMPARRATRMPLAV